LKVLVTGGAGFIGHTISKKYIEKGYKVTILDNLSTGKKENIPNDADFIFGDICDSKIIKKLGSFDLLSHHAAQTSVTFSVKNPLIDARNNIFGTISLLENMKGKINQIIFASTGGAIYGNIKKTATEKHKTNPESPYALNKMTGEKIVTMWAKQNKTKATILRYSNVYGLGQDPHGESGVIAIWMKNILEKKPCVIYGDGNSVRDYVYVEDVANANLLSIGKEGVFNIGTGIGTSTNTLFKMLRPKEKAIYKKAREGEVERSVLDASKAKKIFYWESKTRIQDGIRLTFSKETKRRKNNNE
tara:strand:- start:168 stop:1073 length:906 start_codon:yes stop_codon:yes gene_type:complete